MGKKLYVAWIRRVPRGQWPTKWRAVCGPAPMAVIEQRVKKYRNAFNAKRYSLVILPCELEGPCCER